MLILPLVSVEKRYTCKCVKQYDSYVRLYFFIYWLVLVIYYKIIS